MLLTKEVEIKWNNRYKGHYESKGYTYTGLGDTFIAKIEDVLPSSNAVTVEVLCDYCKTTVVTKTYQNYNKGRAVVKKDCCKGCSSKKTKEVSMLRYGVESWVQLDSSKKQIGDANRGYTQAEVEDIFSGKKYKLLSTYKNFTQKLEFVCQKHRELGIQDTTLHSAIKSIHNCKPCANDYRSEVQRNHNQEEVNEIFQSKHLTLLSEYRNTNQPVEYTCNIHPEVGVQAITLRGLLNGERFCLKCADSVVGMALTIGYVRDLFESINLTLVSSEYTNSEGSLDFVCDKHSSEGVQSCTLGQIRRGVCVCIGCKKDINNEKLMKKQKRDTLEAIELGLFPIREWEYKSFNCKIPYICEIHYDEVQYIALSKLRLGRGCRFCGVEKNKGRSHYNWKGGISSLNNHLRGLLRPLIDEKLRKYNYKCLLTGENGTLEVHHLYSFSSIVRDVMSELDLPIQDDIGLYLEGDLKNMEDLFIKKHRGNWGVPILPELHIDFHNKYGNQNNTKKQFLEFADKIITDLDDLI